MDVLTVTCEAVDDRRVTASVWMFQQLHDPAETDKAVDGPVVPVKGFIDQTKTARLLMIQQPHKMLSMT